MSKRLTRIWAATAAIAASSLLLAACSTGSDTSDATSENEVHELTFLTAVTPGTPSAAVQDWYLDRLEEASDGRLVIDRTAAESLCKATEIAECIKDGRGDFGLTMPDYTPQNFPTVSVVGIPFMNQNSVAITKALYDLHQTNPDGLAIMEKNNLHLILYWPSGRLLFGSEEPLEQVEDRDGR